MGQKWRARAGRRVKKQSPIRRLRGACPDARERAGPGGGGNTGPARSHASGQARRTGRQRFLFKCLHIFRVIAGHGAQVCVIKTYFSECSYYTHRFMF